MLVFWILRRAFLPLMALGLIPVAVSGLLNQDLASELATPQDLIAAACPGAVDAGQT